MSKRVEDKKQSNYSSLAGEFAVLSQLALLGIDANMTLGNTKSVDILLSNPENGRMCKLEVKTKVSKRTKDWIDRADFGKNFAEWQMNKKHETINDPNLYYCFVFIHRNPHAYRFFIVPSKIVATYVRKQHEHWLQSTRPHNDNDARMLRLGFKREQYGKLRPPFIEEYEDRWELLIGKKAQ